MHERVSACDKSERRETRRARRKSGGSGVGFDFIVEPTGRVENIQKVLDQSELPIGDHRSEVLRSFVNLLCNMFCGI